MDIIDSIKEGKCKIVVDECKPHQLFRETVFPTEWETGEQYDWRKVLGERTLFRRCKYCKSRVINVFNERREIVVGKNEQRFVTIEQRLKYGWYCDSCGYLEKKGYSVFL